MDAMRIVSRTAIPILSWSLVAVPLYARVQVALDVLLLDIGLEYPVHPRFFFKIILKIAGRYQTDV